MHTRVGVELRFHICGQNVPRAERRRRSTHEVGWSLGGPLGGEKRR